MNNKMKKAISLLLIVVMVCSLGITAIATNDYTQGTQVQYVGGGAESYTITVPAQLTPGSEGTVTLSGTWASNHTVKVTADATVTLTNSINANDKKVLNVTFAGIEKIGDNTVSRTYTEKVAVAEMPTDALFGTWSGRFNYNVEMSETINNAEPPKFTMVHKPSGEETLATEVFYTIGRDVVSGLWTSAGNIETATQYNAGEYYASMGEDSVLIQEDFSTLYWGANSMAPLDRKLLGKTISELCDYSLVVTWGNGEQTKSDFAMINMNINGEDVLVPTITYSYYDKNGNLLGTADAHSLWIYDDVNKTFILGHGDIVLQENMNFYLDCEDVFLDTIQNR
jgi:hypothetical protein